MFTRVSQTKDVLTANGGADGYITVASNAAYRPGAYVNIADSTGASKRYIVTDLSGATKIGLREEVKPPRGAGNFGGNYGRSNLSSWTTVNTATAFQEAGQVYVDLSNFVNQPLVGI